MNNWLARPSSATALLGAVPNGFNAVAGSVRASAAVSAPLFMPYCEVLRSVSRPYE
jgi:hypothetical protein